MLDFYKPTPSVKGTGCSFSASLITGAIYCSLIKQASWNDKTKRASFEPNRKVPENFVNMKLSLNEAAALVEYFDRGREFITTHTGETQTLFITLKPYLKMVDGKQTHVGSSFFVSKKTSNIKSNFIIGFNFNEGRLIREFLLAAIHEIIKFKINRHDSYILTNKTSRKSNQTGRVFNPNQESESESQSEPEAEPEPESELESDAEDNAQTEEPVENEPSEDELNLYTS